MPQQPATLELTATISDKTFPISSFTINIPINVTHNEVTNYKVGDAYTTLITPKPPTQFGKEHRMTHPINVDIDEQWIRDRFANMLIDMAEELSPGICGWWVPPSLGMSGFDTRFTNAIKAFETTFETNPDEVGAVKS